MHLHSFKINWKNKVDILLNYKTFLFIGYFFLRITFLTWYLSFYTIFNVL